MRGRETSANPIFWRIEMKCTMNCALALILVFVVPVIACPPTPLGWTITDPVASPEQSYGANIACEGESTTADTYIIKVFAITPTGGDGDILQSQSGTATACAWSTTVPEPSGGWPLAGGPSRAANLAIFVDSVKKNDVRINLVQ